MMQHFRTHLFATAAALACVTAAASADELKIGTKLELQTLDPHFFASFPSETSHTYLYDRLVETDENLSLVPGLAKSWEAIDEDTWELTLQDGVTFHDGSALDAEDVAATFRRLPAVPNSPNSFARAVRDFESVEIVDDKTLRIHTSVPSPQLMRFLTGVIVIPSEYENATTQEFNDGDAAIGTGPYKLEEWRQGEALIVTKNEDYWRGEPTWDRVEEVVLANDGARSAALLADAVDAITYVPVEDLERIEGDERFKVHVGPIARIHYIAIDSARDDTPHVSAPDGSNPLQNAKVREALSLAINREAIVDRLLKGIGEPAGQVLPATFEGGVEGLGPDTYDPERAKALLAEAGYPDGFSMTFHATNARYPADVEIAQAIAQMWTVIGLDVEVEALARTIFFPRATDYEFSIYTAQYGDDTNLQMGLSMLRSRDEEKGLGNGNRSRYSNTTVDEALDAAYLEADPDKRNTLTSEAISAAMGEHGLIPLYYPGFAVAARDDIDVTIWANARAAATSMKPAE